MNIEIALPGRMTQSGSSLLRLIQNNDMPLVDLLVRESIQNSLDAHAPESSTVCVKFSMGLFDSLKYLEQLEGVSDALKARFPGKRQHYMAIRDSGTVGLTGPLHYDDVTDGYGNLLKLVYEISKPQEAGGSGGSWGLGKTVYFRIGIGMVVYYSRIKEENGNYSSRLAVSMVEDESGSNAIIPVYENKAKRGIAWWGEKIGENKTQPVQDESIINDILSLFQISPFNEKETGTVIIIPYIDEEKLVNSNSHEYETAGGRTIKPYWYSNLEQYITIAIQRWYCPRLDNLAYKYGPCLKAFVNEQEISCLETPLFYLAQALYNYASGKETDGVYEWHGIKVYLRTINHRGILEKNNSGRVAYCKASTSFFKEEAPDNKYNPYVFANCDRQNPNVNPPVMMYCRKPGMVVSYEATGIWVDGITPTTQGEYIIAFFALDSEAYFKEMCNGDKLSLEEYVRKSELADHTSWSDYTLTGSRVPNPRIVSKFRSQIARAIAKTYEDEPVTTEKSVNVGLAKLFGDLLLPPLNFGKQPSIGGGKPGGEVVGKDRGALLRINRNKIVFNAEGNVVFPFRLDVDANYGQQNCFISTEVAVENKTVTASAWEDLTDTPLPFRITAVTITEIGQGKKMKNSRHTIDAVQVGIETLTISRLVTNKGCWFGISITSDETDAYAVKGLIAVSSQDKSVKTGFRLDVSHK